MIISSPADVDQQNCGYPIASFTHSACAKLDLHETFMVSFCCGTKDCKAAGAERRDLLDDYSDEDDMVLTVNGTVLEPLQVGYPPQEPELVAARDPPAALAPVKRAKGRCHHNWKAKKGKNSFTADSKTRIEVLDDYSGGTATITKTRSQSWTHDVSVSFGLTFEDVLSLGVSMGESFTKEVSDSSSYSFHAPKGQVGSVVFTPKLLCTTGEMLSNYFILSQPPFSHLTFGDITGEGTCDGGKVKGTLCSPYHPDGPNRLSGTYGLVVHG